MREKDNQKKDIIDCINYIPYSNLIIIEIGSFSGESCELFLNSGKVSKIYCIDPWKNDWSDMAKKYHFDMNNIENTFDLKFKNDNRVIKHKGTIDSFIEQYKNINNIDFVYIDGNHSYSYVYNDISKSLDYLKPKYIGGHDYFSDNRNLYLSGVYKSVSELIGKPDSVFIDHSWIKKL